MSSMLLDLSTMESGPVDLGFTLLNQWVLPRLLKVCGEIDIERPQNKQLQIKTSCYCQQRVLLGRHQQKRQAKRQERVLVSLLISRLPLLSSISVTQQEASWQKRNVVCKFPSPASQSRPQIIRFRVERKQFNNKQTNNQPRALLMHQPPWPLPLFTHSPSLSISLQQQCEDNSVL